MKLEDYQKREKHIISYCKSQIAKLEKRTELYYNPENNGKISAYKDILYKLEYRNETTLQRQQLLQ